MLRPSMFTITLIIILTLSGLSAADAGIVNIELSDGGTPANGTYDLEISVFDAERDGQLLDRWMVVGIEAVNGRLQVPSELRTAPPTGTLWLEARVRDAGEGTFEQLPGRIPMDVGKQFGVCQVSGDLSVAGGIGVGTATPASALHIVDQTSPPMGLPADQNGLMLGSDANGERWMQSYGGPLLLNPQGNTVGIGVVDPSVALNVNGFVKAHGFLQPGTGGESLRIVRGRIASDGTISGGSGFSVSKSTTGIYTVFLDQMFSTVPAVTATVFNASGGRVAVSANASNQFEFTTWTAQGTVADRDIEFIAIGNP
jgi:hypothetical protein